MPRSQPLPPRADVVVVGAGFGGLAAALTLAEAGAEVVLLEALNYPGGCASTFRREGYAFEAGATLLSGFGEGQLMERLIERHGIDVTIDWLDPVIELVTPRMRLPIWRDRERFVDAFCALDGAPEAGLRRFFKRQARVADALWELFASPELLPPFGARELFGHLRRTPRYLPILPLIGQTLGAVADGDGVGDFEPLRIYLDALCQITVQTPAHEAEAPIALAATDYAFRGTAHVRGGVGEMAWGLLRAAAAAGASVHRSTRVRGMRRHEGQWVVETRHGDVVAPVVIANLLPQRVSQLAGLQDSASLDGLSEQVADGWGAVMWYLALDDAAVPYDEAHHLELVADPGAPFIEGNHIFCSISARRETERAPAGQRTLTMSTHLAASRLRDANDPGALVAEVQRRMRDTLSRLAPELEAGVVKAMPASPRTFARFTGRPEGLVGGIPRRAGLAQYGSMFPRAVAPGLHLVGDTIFPGQSTLATAIGGMKTAQAVLRSSVLRAAG